MSRPAAPFGFASRLTPALGSASRLTAILVGALVAPPAFAQPKFVSPAYPTLATPANLGLQRGTTSTLTLTGTNLADVTAVWLSFPATVTVSREAKPSATAVTVTLDVPADAPVGLHALRVVTAAGPSNLRPFTVDELPAVAETRTNRTREKPQAVPVPCVVTGTADVEASDFFRFPVKAGRPVTLEVLGRRLGSPIDPVLILYDGAGRELPGVYADDTPGLQTDARLTYTPKADGDLIAEVRDTTYRGGPDYGYRLRIGTFPGATTAFPLAVKRGKSATIGFAGPDLDGVPAVTVTAPSDPAVPVVYATPKRAGGVAGWPVPVRVHDHPEAVEQEPNDTPAQATPVPVPGGVSARFLTKNDVDYFRFPGKKGRKVVVRAMTYELNAPTEVYLRVLDGKGAELGKSNPQQPGVRVEFAPPADGDYFAVCEHLNYQHGPNEVYHLSVLPAAPDFAVTLGTDRTDVPAGGVDLLPVTGVTRANGFAGPVELTVAGDGVRGSLTLPPGANPTPAAPLLLPLTAEAGAKPGLRVVTVRAAAKIDGAEVVRFASAAEVVKAGLAGLPNPPAEWATRVAVVVTPPTPFTLAVALDAAEVAKGGTVKGTVTVRRTDAAVGEVKLAALGLPANVALKLSPVAKGATTASIELTPAANATPGPAVVFLRGTAKVGGKDVEVTAAPVTVAIK